MIHFFQKDMSKKDVMTGFGGDSHSLLRLFASDVDDSQLLVTTDRLPVLSIPFLVSF